MILLARKWSESKRGIGGRLMNVFKCKLASLNGKQFAILEMERKRG